MQKICWRNRKTQNPADLYKTKGRDTRIFVVTNEHLFLKSIVSTSMNIRGYQYFRVRHGHRSNSPEDIITKMWSSVRTNNGIKVLLSLLLVKTPLVNADKIRVLACKALYGLSRSDKIKQVIGKLQLFNSGQLQSK